VDRRKPRPIGDKKVVDLKGEGGEKAAGTKKRSIRRGKRRNIHRKKSNGATIKEGNGGESPGVLPKRVAANEQRGGPKGHETYPIQRTGDKISLYSISN